MSNDVLDALNEVQRTAVTEIQGPCSVIAGAGSGKTRVLTARVIYLIQEQQVDASSIIALTFTNKAAQEMRHRISEHTQEDVSTLWIGTFHALFRRILSKHAHLLGYTSSFSIYDTDDSLALAKQVLKDADLGEEICKPRQLLHQISKAKQELVPWTAFVGSEDKQLFRLGPLYKSYVKHCHQANAMDFDDLLFNIHLLFKQHTEVLASYQEKFKYVLIDEFQDTNRAQYLTAQQLALPENNICVVGDDSQSIYSFRGARIENILDFQSDYPGTRLIRLEQNYRSTSTITKAADSLIAKNTKQIPKKLWSANAEGQLIKLIQGRNEGEEARLIASLIFEQQHSFGYALSEIGILYRRHNQSRSLEEALRYSHIPYRIYGSLSFFQRKEIKDLLAYFRIVINPQDDVALQRIINLPKRGIGGVTMERLWQSATDHDISLWEAILGAEDLFDAVTAKLLIGFRALIDPLIKAHEAQPPAYEFALRIAKVSGLLQVYQEDEDPKNKARIQNIEELLNAIHSFRAETRADDSLDAFLQEVALLTEVETEGSSTDAVQLMTIHMAKGLEFKIVFVVGLEEELFPSYQSRDNLQSLEEERRLFYVAMTRAKEQLFLSYAVQRYQYGSSKSCEPSRFLSEISADYIHQSSHHQLNYIPQQRPQRSATRSVAQPTQPRLKQLKNIPPGPSASSYQVGMKVEHRLFGTGKILELTHDHNPKAHILFDTHGEKTLVLQYARLTIL